MKSKTWKEQVENWGETVVGFVCIECGKFIPRNINGGSRNKYCRSCFCKVNKRRDNTEEPLVKLTICKMCGNEIINSRNNRYQIIEGDPRNYGRLYCRKCFEVHNKIYMKEYYKVYTEGFKIRSKEQWLSKKPQKICPDCGRDITNEVKRRSYRCRKCQDDVNRKKSMLYTRQYNKRYKWLVNEKSRCLIGTLSTTADCHLKRKEDGTPDWEKETRAVKDLKERISKRKDNTSVFYKDRYFGYILSDD